MRKQLRWFRQGSSTIVAYFYILLLAVIAALVITEYCSTHITAEHSQLMADTIADGASLMADTGFGINQKVASQVANDLVKRNAKIFDLGKLTATVKATKGTKSDIGGELKVVTKTKGKNIVTGKSFIAEARAKARTLYTGGQAIVLIAYAHTYQANPNSQTKYILGAGRGPRNGDWWEYYADCSSLVAGVYNMFGEEYGHNYNVPAYTGNLQFCGQHIADCTPTTIPDTAKPGDIILYWSWEVGASRHVAIYAGRDKNGVDYVIHNSGGAANNSIETAGQGPTGGCVFVPSSQVYGWGCKRMEIRRLIDDDGNLLKMDYNKDFYNLGDETASLIALRLSEAGYSPAAIGGILGSIFKESGFCTIAVEKHYGKYQDPYNIEYAKALNSGAVSMSDFVNRYQGFGLCQWTTSDRKALLWNTAKERNADITDIEVQIATLLKEMNSNYAYFGSDAFKNETDVFRATEKFYYDFEGPPDNDPTLPERKAIAALICGKLKSL